MSVLERYFTNSIFVLPLLLCSFGVSAGDLTIDIRDVRGTKGKLQVAVFDREEAYRASDYEQAYALFTLSINTGSNGVTLHGLPRGEYAISLFHDENSNDEMEIGLTGMPQEGYGTSNAIDKYDEPSFAEAGVSVEDKHKTVQVQIYYMGSS